MNSNPVRTLLIGAVVAASAALGGCSGGAANATSYDRLIVVDNQGYGAPSNGSTQTVGGKGKGLGPQTLVRTRVASSPPPPRAPNPAPPPPPPARPPRPH